MYMMMLMIGDNQKQLNIQVQGFILCTSTAYKIRRLSSKGYTNVGGFPSNSIHHVIILFHNDHYQTRTGYTACY